MTQSSSPLPPLLEMRGITKIFGNVRANDGIDLVLNPGDVLGLLGENGAGKTTLMNVLFGAYRADAGEIRVNGREVRLTSPAQALAHGIGMVHQHFHLAPSLSVLDNLMAGLPGRHGLLDKRGARAKLKIVGRDFGLELDPDRLVSTLAVGERQRLEIMKALFRDARILILDEPTAVLIPSEVEGLFAALRAMSAKGFGIIFISHKLNEVRAVANRALVLRRGRVSGRIDDPVAAGDAVMARMMCGRDIDAPVKAEVRAGAPLLHVDGVSTAGHGGTPLKSVSFTVRGGEILGVAGVSGNGQKALADVLAGTLRPSAGHVRIKGRAVARYAPHEMQDLGLGRIPEDRMSAGLVTTLPVAESMVISRIGHHPFSRFGLIDRKAVRTFAAERIRAFDIRCSGPAERAGALSGGNLQKILLARELAFDPLVLLAAQPTRGLDIGAARFVHDRFLDLRARGRAIVLVSEDLEELMTLADRIAVMYEGRIVGTLAVARATVERLGLLMGGIAVPEAA